MRTKTVLLILIALIFMCVYLLLDLFLPEHWIPTIPFLSDHWMLVTMPTFFMMGVGGQRIIDWLDEDDCA